MALIILGAAIAVFLSVFLWIKSGRSPFWWAAMSFILLEAIRVEAWGCVVPAAREFVHRVRVRFAELKSEIGATA